MGQPELESLSQDGETLSIIDSLKVDVLPLLTRSALPWKPRPARLERPRFRRLARRKNLIQNA